MGFYERTESENIVILTGKSSSLMPVYEKFPFLVVVLGVEISVLVQRQRDSL